MFVPKTALLISRGMVQFGRTRDLGLRSRRFESGYPDHIDLVQQIFLKKKVDFLIFKKIYVDW